MATPQEIESSFWKALRSDMTMMLGLDGVEDGHTRPMTAQLESDEDRGPIWFFCSKDTALPTSLTQGHRAIATFTSKGHDVFATVQGTLSLTQDAAMIDKLWNRFVAAWYPGGKTDPNLALLRLDAEHAEIWLTGSSLVTGLKMLLGADMTKDAKERVAEVSLK